MSSLRDLHESLARVVVVDRDLGDILTDITAVARNATPAFDAASITLIDGEKAFTAAYNGQLAMLADELQYERGYGPCLDAGLAGQALLIHDMATEQRWPDYTRTVARHGIASSLSMPLPYQSTTIGALNGYATRPHAFGAEDRKLAEEVATWTALAIGPADAAARTSQELAQLQLAMKSRAVIEQAKGILIERYKVDEDMAFTLLSRASQDGNVKLRDVADQLVRTGALPGVAERG
ncbi:MAG TPA: GAF and ANTAR domain-containing protein [Polyangiaceae bacterium]|nr:GAF and ANTAR domain-containing protein [Polyangiaceae bacterium]